ncbi:universal stress protein B [Escherichia coli]|uniref:Universal stress protein B n=1 Tax=Escherichia coli TaxID=562 RepID=A0A376CWV9_ECOLX|nr:universal stress protein B [Escherichia coli]
MISTVALFWALCVVCIVNMARYFSSLRALLVVLRNCDPLLYQYVDGGGFFTSHGQPNKQVRLVWYIYAQRYRDHHDDEFIRRCERVRRQFILTSALCGLWWSA